MTAISSRLCSAEKSHEDVPTIVRTIGKGGTGWVLREDDKKEEKEEGAAGRLFVATLNGRSRTTS